MVFHLVSTEMFGISCILKRRRLILRTLRTDTIRQCAQHLRRRLNAWTRMWGRCLGYFLLALVLVFLALALVFFPDLHPHVLHICSPFVWGLQSLIGPQTFIPSATLYLSAAKATVNKQFLRQRYFSGAFRAAENFRLTRHCEP